MATGDKTMFEIYRESDYNRAFHCIFYTDLDEHHRDAEIARAMSGETVFTGYVSDESKDEARRVVESIVDELNEMDEDEATIPRPEIERRLGPLLATTPSADAS
jgi:hypothetical protein